MSVFRRDGGAFAATSHARGPWDAGSQHGGAPAALMTRELQALAPEMGLARMTFEILGPVPIAPVRVTAAVVKPGRRFQLAEAELSAADGRALMRARAVLLRRAPVTAAAGETALPAGPPDGPRAGGWGEGDAFHRTAMEIRDAGGTWSGEGAARTWFRAAMPLVEGEGPPTGAALAAAVADFANGTSMRLRFDEWLFVNTDLTVHLHRQPAGEWLLLDARTVIGADGAGLARSRLYDAAGEVGLGAQSLYVERR